MRRMFLAAAVLAGRAAAAWAQGDLLADKAKQDALFDGAGVPPAAVAVPGADPQKATRGSFGRLSAAAQIPPARLAHHGGPHHYTHFTRPSPFGDPYPYHHHWGSRYYYPAPPYPPHTHTHVHAGGGPGLGFFIALGALVLGIIALVALL